MRAARRPTARRLLTLTWLTVGLFLLVVPVANAYIDPGSGSFIFQVVVGSAMAAGMAVKVFWRRIVEFFHRSGRERTPSP